MPPCFEAYRFKSAFECRQKHCYDYKADECCKKGLIIGAVSGNVIRVAPPLVITKEEADESLDIMEKVLTSLNF